MMKKTTILNFLMLITIGMNAQQEKKENLWVKKPLERSPIFASYMPVCVVEVTLEYGKELGLSAKSFEVAHSILGEAKKQVPTFKKKVRELELELLKASQEERYEDFERVLDEIVLQKKKDEIVLQKKNAVLFLQKLIKKARKEYPKADMKKIDTFVEDNKEIYLQTMGL